MHVKLQDMVGQTEAKTQPSHDSSFVDPHPFGFVGPVACQQVLILSLTSINEMGT